MRAYSRRPSLDDQHFLMRRKINGSMAAQIQIICCVFSVHQMGKTDSSIALDSNGDLLQIPEIYSARHGEVALPATFGLLNWFQEAVPVHLPLLYCSVVTPVTLDFVDSMYHT